jgi:hypothetical protein
MNDKEKLFFIAKCMASDIYERRRVHINLDDLKSKLRRAELKDELVLLKFMDKSINDHNSKVSADLTRLNNLSFKSNWMESQLFNSLKIPYRNISEAVNIYPTMDYYDIYRQFFRDTNS